MQQVTKRSGKKAKVASVLLLTDGQANVGPSTKESILDAMRNHMSYDGAQAHQPNAPRSRRMNPFAVSTLCIAVMYIAISKYCMYSSATITVQ